MKIVGLWICFLPILAALKEGTSAGQISGRITPAEKLKSISVIERESGKIWPGEFDTVWLPGKFIFKGLPPGKYDLILETSQGKVEGVNLKVGEGEPSTAGALADKDKAAIQKHISGMKGFANKRRWLYIRGSSKEARALVEEIRNQPTTLRSKEPLVFWRVEIWHYVKLYGTWRRKTTEVVQRHKFTAKEFKGLSWIFEPALGGIKVEEEKTTEINYQIPEKFDSAKGLVPSQ